MPRLRQLTIPLDALGIDRGALRSQCGGALAPQSAGADLVFARRTGMSGYHPA